MQAALESIVEQVRAARSERRRLRIVGGASKAQLLGAASEGELLALAPLSGIVSYEPSELVLTALAGTPLRVIETALAATGQALPFEPPAFGDTATLGGVVACGFSGPSRPWRGSVRDAVLGVQMINGKGECLRFGGQVMKNVAGYDLARLQVGAFGCLGVLTEISVKVLPAPTERCTRVLSLGRDAAHAAVVALQRGADPVTGTWHEGETLAVRFAGAAPAVHAAAARLGGEALSSATADALWHDVREQRHAFFSAGTALWRFSLPVAAPYPELPGVWATEWAGAQRWLRVAADVQRNAFAAHAFVAAASAHGHAQAWRPRGAAGHVGAVRQRLQQRIRAAFDPDGVFNPGVTL